MAAVDDDVFSIAGVLARRRWRRFGVAAVWIARREIAEPTHRKTVRAHGRRVDIGSGHGSGAVVELRAAQETARQSRRIERIIGRLTRKNLGIRRLPRNPGCARLRGDNLSAAAIDQRYVGAGGIAATVGTFVTDDRQWGYVSPPRASNFSVCHISRVERGQLNLNGKA